MFAGGDFLNLIGKSLIHHTVDGDHTGREVHIATFYAVDTADVQDQLSVHQDPHVVVTVELEVHFIAEQVTIGGVSLGIQLPRHTGQIEADIHFQAKCIVGCHIFGAFRVLGIIAIVGNPCILSLFAMIAVGWYELSTRIGIRRVERKEVRHDAGIDGVGGCAQIIVNIEPPVALVIGRRVSGRVIIIVTVMGIIGIHHQMEQVIAGAQIGFTDDALPCIGIHGIIGTK